MESLAEKEYAVVSCHVERPLDDRAWGLFSRLQARRPGGFRIAALMRPPTASEDERRWLERAREAAARGPLGHHAHFGGAERGRPLESGPEPAAQVRAEALWVREAGLEPRFFCGGNWYMDAAVAAVLADFGYADCTATGFRPAHLPAGAPRLGLAAPAWLLVDGRRLLELPTTHSLGMAARASLRPRAPGALHVYFHDTDLLDGRRRAALVAALTVLGVRRRATDLDRLAAEAAGSAPGLDFALAAGG